MSVYISTERLRFPYLRWDRAKVLVNFPPVVWLPREEARCLDARAWNLWTKRCLGSWNCQWHRTDIYCTAFTTVTKDPSNGSRDCRSRIMNIFRKKSISSKLVPGTQLPFTTNGDGDPSRVEVRMLISVPPCDHILTSVIDDDITK